MTVNKTELKEYYREIEKLLVCDRKQKTAFMAELQANIDEYIAGAGETDMESIKAEFGTPEVIAESFLSNSNVLTIKKKLDIKKCIIIAVVIALLIYLAFVIMSLIDVHTEAHGYMQEGIMMINTFIGGEGI